MTCSLCYKPVINPFSARRKETFKNKALIPAPMSAVVDEDTCIGCGACVDVCPVDAISMNDKAKIDADTCTECGACVDECPVEAISL